MSKHTPGPWYYQMDVFNGMLQGYDVYQVGGEQVVGCEGIDLRLGAEQAEDNARLIAAAPELLEALEAAVACGMVPISSAKEGGEVTHSIQVRVADQIRDAITKATGEPA